MDPSDLKDTALFDLAFAAVSRERFASLAGNPSASRPPPGTVFELRDDRAWPAAVAEVGAALESGAPLSFAGSAAACALAELAGGPTVGIGVALEVDPAFGDSDALVSFCYQGPLAAELEARHLDGDAPFSRSLFGLGLVSPWFCIGCAGDEVAPAPSGPGSPQVATDDYTAGLHDRWRREVHDRVDDVAGQLEDGELCVVYPCRAPRVVLEEGYGDDELASLVGTAQRLIGGIGTEDLSNLGTAFLPPPLLSLSARLIRVRLAGDADALARAEAILAGEGLDPEVPEADRARVDQVLAAVPRDEQVARAPEILWRLVLAGG